MLQLLAVSTWDNFSDANGAKLHGGGKLAQNWKYIHYLCNVTCIRSHIANLQYFCQENVDSKTHATVGVECLVAHVTCAMSVLSVDIKVCLE